MLAVTGGGTLSRQNTTISKYSATTVPLALVPDAGSNWSIAGDLVSAARSADGWHWCPDHCRWRNGHGGHAPSVATITAGSSPNLGTGGLSGSISVSQIQVDGRIIANFTDTSTLAANSVDSSGDATLIMLGTGTAPRRPRLRSISTAAPCKTLC